MTILGSNISNTFGYTPGVNTGLIPMDQIVNTVRSVTPTAAPITAQQSTQTPRPSYMPPLPVTQLTPQPTKSTKSSTQNASVSGVSNRDINSTTVGRSDTTSQATTNRRQQNMSDPSLAALEGLISNLVSGNDPILNAINQATGRGFATNQEVDMQADPNSAAARAQGRVQDQTRKLLEMILPEIYGGAEAAGIAGNNALSSLLTQDAAVRTAEASNRAVEEAYQAAVTQRIQNQQALQGLLQTGSPTTEYLIDALNTAKGAVETGQEVQRGRSQTTNVENTTGRETTSTQTNTATASNESAELLDPLEWAKLQAALNQLNSGEPSAGEKALALFQAMKGPWQNLSDLSNFSPTGVISDTGQRQTSRDLMEQIQRYL